MDQNPRGGEGRPGADQEGAPNTGRTRRFGASRVRPRVEFGAPKTTEPQQPLTPEVLDDGPGGDYSGSSTGAPLGGGGSPFGGGSDPFAPRNFAGGRVRVYGCSPGCLGASVLISLILTILLNALL